MGENWRHQAGGGDDSLRCLLALMNEKTSHGFLYTHLWDRSLCIPQSPVVVSDAPFSFISQNSLLFLDLTDPIETFLLIIFENRFLRCMFSFVP